MRKTITASLVGALIIVLALVAIFTAGCGAWIGNTLVPQAAGTAAPTTAQGILEKAMLSQESLTSGTGEFGLSVNVNADKSKLPAGAEALLGQPIAVSGTFSGSEEPKAAEASMNISVAGQSIPVAMKMVDDKAWIQFMGQWYEMPADMMGAGTTGTTEKAMDAAAIMQALTAAGVDPTTWLTNLTVVGEENVGGTPAYHLTATVDMNKIVTDAVKLMSDKNIQGLMGSLGADMMGTTGTSLQMPSAQELQTLQSELGQVFQNVTVDMWIAKDTYQLRQAELNASLVPPAGQDSQGINGITLNAKMSVAPATSPVTVTPPTDAKPFSDLENSLGALQGLFSGALGGGTLGQ
jgi:Family of unknown function (DUF6612)